MEVNQPFLLTRWATSETTSINAFPQDQYWFSDKELFMSVFQIVVISWYEFDDESINMVIHSEVADA